MTGTILDIINRTPIPAPWSEGDNIPWDDPDFSERMLAEHLSQAHDLASRRAGTIDRHVAWIREALLGGRPARVLDLACGPGLYTSRLARVGCECVGIDFSPASIRHSKATASAELLSCEYQLADLRQAAFGSGFDLVMLLFGQFNVFEREKGAQILQKAYRALKPGGQIVMEVQSKAQICKDGHEKPSWYSSPEGLFAAGPHIVLQENFWSDELRASTFRFSVIKTDGPHCAVDVYALSNEAYSEPELTTLLESIGFVEGRWFPSMAGEAPVKQRHLPVIVAQK